MEKRTIEEIIVTAQKREQSLMDVGIAITALSADDMTELGMRETRDIIHQVPGIMAHHGRGNWIVRGVGTQQEGMGQESATSIYIDDTYFYWAQASGQQLYDMKQSEVLKGPQGTLFGRNATGGLVHFRTQDPSWEAGGFVDLTYGRYNQVRAEAAYGGPLGSKVSGRIAALVNQHDGYLKSHTDVPDQEDADHWGVRGKLLFEPSEKWSIILTGFVSDQDARAVGARLPFVSRYNDEGLGERIDDPEVTDFFGWRNPSWAKWDHWFNVDTRNYIRLVGGHAKIDWTGDSMNFRSITSYGQGERFNVEDVDGSPNDVAHMGGPPWWPNDNDWLTQEFNLSGGDRFRWTAGAFYLHIQGVGCGNPLVYGELLVGDDAPLASRVCTDDEITSWAGFGQLEYDLSDRLRLVAGLRYTDEVKRQYKEEYMDFNDGASSFFGQR